MIEKNVAYITTSDPNDKHSWSGTNHYILKILQTKFKQVDAEIQPGVKVMMKKNHQVGQVMELRGKRAVVKIGLLPMQVDLKDLVVVTEK